MNKAREEPLWARCGDTTPRDRRNLRRMLVATAVWAISFSGVSLMIKKGLLTAGPVPWLLAVLPIIAGFFVLVTFARYLREADELQRMIQLRALAVGFGGTLLTVVGYRVFERLGAPAAGLDDVTLVMAGIYSIAAVVGSRLYR